MPSAKTARSRTADTFTADAIVGTIQSNLEGAATEFLSQLGTLIAQYERRIVLVAESRAAFDAARAANTVPLTVILSTSEAAALLPPPTPTTTTADAPQTGEDGSKKPAEEEETVKPDYVIKLNLESNASLLREVEWLRLEAGRIARQLDKISDWIALNIPSINEENSAATEILAAVLEQIQSLVEAVRSIVGLPKKYLSDRADVEKELLKLPESRAIQMQLELVDTEMWDEVERSWKALVRVALICHSVITKNRETLYNPRQAVTAAEASIYY